MPYQKGGTATKERSISTPGAPARPESGLTADEVAQKVAEEAREKAPMGQEAFNDYMRAKLTEGIEDSDVPEKIFRGEESVEPPSAGRP